jgi:hypothetical protein
VIATRFSLSAIALASLIAIVWAVGPVAADTPDCSSPPTTADLRVLRTAVGSVLELRAPSSYYPGCDEVGDPITAEVDWGDGTAKAAHLESVPGYPDRFAVVARHRYLRRSGPTGFAIVITQRNARTGALRTDRHYVSLVARRPQIAVVRLDGRPRLFKGVVARIATDGWKSTATLRTTISWGDGTSSRGDISRASSGFVVRGRHRWRHRVVHRRLQVTFKDTYSGVRFVASRSILIE